MEALEAEEKKQEEAATAERRKLEREEHEKNLASAKAKDALIAAQKAE